MQIANTISDTDGDRRTDERPDSGNTICPFHHYSNDGGAVGGGEAAGKGGGRKLGQTINENQFYVSPDFFLFSLNSLIFE